MGLFAKRPPCPICGGKVKGLLTWKVGGEKVCDDCYGFVDLPDKMVDTMSIEEFKQYMVFRDENDVLRQEFQETQRIDFGWLDTKFLFDMPPLPLHGQTPEEDHLRGRSDQVLRHPGGQHAPL